MADVERIAAQLAELTAAVSAPGRCGACGRPAEQFPSGSWAHQGLPCHARSQTAWSVDDASSIKAAVQFVPDGEPLPEAPDQPMRGRPEGPTVRQYLAREAERATAERIAHVLTRYRFTWDDEYELQDAIAHVLAQHVAPVEREVTLAPRCRIDILVGRVGIEIKVKGSVETVARQLQRYATTGRLDALVLATTRATHHTLPTELGGMPVTVVNLTHLA